MQHPGLSPRVRGNPPQAHHGFSKLGLSPRVRGTRPAGGIKPHLPRSIPARAGEPPALPRLVNQRMVYPRACGGTQVLEEVSTLPGGLSPRVRGNRLR